ncbi:hypothetical protein [Longispora urticae]
METRARYATAVTELRIRLDTRASAPFPWALVSFTDLPDAASRADLDGAGPRLVRATG